MPVLAIASSSIPKQNTYTDRKKITRWVEMKRTETLAANSTVILIGPTFLAIFLAVFLLSLFSFHLFLNVALNKLKFYYPFLFIYLFIYLFK